MLTKFLRRYLSDGIGNGLDRIHTSAARISHRNASWRQVFVRVESCCAWWSSSVDPTPQTRELGRSTRERRVLDAAEQIRSGWGTKVCTDIDDGEENAGCWVFNFSERHCFRALGSSRLGLSNKRTFVSGALESMWPY